MVVGLGTRSERQKRQPATALKMVVGAMAKTDAPGPTTPVWREGKPLTRSGGRLSAVAHRID